MTETVKLFSPYSLRGVTLSNRIVISPMCQYSAHEGYLDTWHKIHLGRVVMGGAGLIFTEATAVQNLAASPMGVRDFGRTVRPARMRKSPVLQDPWRCSAIQLPTRGAKAGCNALGMGTVFLLRQITGGAIILGSRLAHHQLRSIMDGPSLTK